VRIYVASSWRNNVQPHVVQTLRAHGHRVYDFKHPAADNQGFHWHDVRVPGDMAADGSIVSWRDWTPAQFREALKSDVAERGFSLDMNALNDCEACVLVLPCGKSAHLELGQAVGAGKRTIVYMPRQEEAELMYLMCDHLCLSMEEVIEKLKLGPRPGLPDYGRDQYDGLIANMNKHHEEVGLPAPTPLEVSQAYIRLYGTNSFYGKIPRPQVWYGPEDHG
jgi:hypothetical protein